MCTGIYESLCAAMATLVFPPSLVTMYLSLAHSYPVLCLHYAQLALLTGHHDSVRAHGYPTSCYSYYDCRQSLSSEHVMKAMLRANSSCITVCYQWCLAPPPPLLLYFVAGIFTHALLVVVTYNVCILCAGD